jgi:N-acetylglucosamine kinase-like BadF-type ATPase
MSESLSIDIGQSGSRAKISGSNQIWSNSYFFDSQNPLRLLTELKNVFPEIGNYHFKSIAVSATGFNGHVPDISQYFAELKKDLHFEELVVMDDGLASYAGAVENLDGVVISLGSGTVCLAKSGNKYLHMDGLGSLFGDEGSGFWLGQQGLRFALASWDHRKNANELQRFFETEIGEFLNLKSKFSIEAHYLCVKSGVRLLEAADLGIQEAVEIRNKGAQDIANMFMYAWKEASQSSSETPTFSLLGKISSNMNYRELILQKTKNLISTFKFIEPLGDQLEGALTIASNPVEGISDLVRKIHHSEV